MPTTSDVKSDSHAALAATRYLHRKILTRLFLGWLFLSMVIGGGILWFEISRIQHTVHSLALEETRAFSGESAHALDQLDANAREHLTQLATQLVKQHFLVAELYDVNKQLQIEVVQSGLEKAEQRIDGYRHRFPNQGAFSREFHFIDGKLLLVMLVPVTGSDGSVIGYFEGIYQVDDRTLHALIDDLMRTLAFVTVAITFTTVLMYPIIYTLNRALTHLLGDLLKGNLELMNVLGCAIAERDSDTNTHNYRVTYYAMRLGEAIGLPQENLRNLIVGAFLHDVGKIGIRDPILLKPDKLTAEEFQIMKTHVTLGVAIVTKSSWLNDARQVVEFHHEKYDGTGYLQGLKGEDIPLNARIFAIVDVFDALTARRAYKEPWSTEKAIVLLKQESGTHFDPQLVNTFSRIAPQLQREINALAESEVESMVERLTAHYVLINM